MEKRETYQTPIVQVIEMQLGAIILEASLDKSWDVEKV